VERKGKEKEEGDDERTNEQFEKKKTRKEIEKHGYRGVGNVPVTGS
jgi:hypothetical protein